MGDAFPFISPVLPRGTFTFSASSFHTSTAPRDVFFRLRGGDLRSDSSPPDEESSMADEGPPLSVGRGVLPLFLREPAFGIAHLPLMTDKALHLRDSNDTQLLYVQTMCKARHTHTLTHVYRQTTEETEIAATITSKVQEVMLPTVTADDSNGSGEFLKNPFQRSSRLAHSPPPMVRTRSESPWMQNFSFAKAMTAEEIYRAIGDKVKELSEMMELPKRNINQPMRDLVANITDLHKNLEIYVLTSKNQSPRGTNRAISAVKDGCTQTSPLIKRTTDCTPKRAIANAAASSAKRSKKNRVEVLKNTQATMNEHAGTEEWELVKTKKNRKAYTQNTIKPDEKNAERSDARSNKT